MAAQYVEFTVWPITNKLTSKHDTTATCVPSLTEWKITVYLRAEGIATQIERFTNVPLPCSKMCQKLAHF